MGNKNSKSRRQFLVQSTIATLSLGLVPVIGKANKHKNHKSNADCNKTTLDYYGEGPFYKDNPPTIASNKLASDTEKGTKLILTGRVRNLDCSEFIPNTVIDIWHANDAGQYDNSGFNLRGKTQSNAQGFYVFETIKPGKYLNGSKYRPSHIHLKITPPDASTITTQIYFKGDTDIKDDAAASITSGQYDASHRIIELQENSEGHLEGTWDIVVDGKGILNVADAHIDKGMIYSASPNPFTDKLVIKYGVFKAAKVGIVIYDSLGSTIANLKNEKVSKGKYEEVWTPPSDAPMGIYFIALKVNDMQVHYLKVLRK